jgi:transposase
LPRRAPGDTGGAGKTGAEGPQVVLEPTRKAWIVLAHWFRARGAQVVMVPTTQSADLRNYYSKHTKNDRLDSEIPSGCRSCIPKDCVSSPVMVQPTPCDGW